MKNWQLIFNTNNYHYVLIKEEIKENYLKFYFKHAQEIKSIPSYFFMLPEIKDIDNESYNKNILSYFAPLLKQFMETPDKKTLFIEEVILKTLVKEDKLNNFFRLLVKNNKNIVLFYYSDMEQYIDIQNTSSLKMKEDELSSRYSLLDRFTDIKIAVENKVNPFKDPINAFHDLQKEH